MSRPRGSIGTPRGASLAERLAFRRRVTDAGCWEWTGSLSNGYGAIQVDGKGRYVHRLVWEQEVGPIPAGMEIDHLCRNRACHNPAHLEPVTPQVNVRRGFSPGAVALRRDNCLRGHAYATWGATRCGRRICRLCSATRARAQRALGKERCRERAALGLPIVDLDAIFADESAMAELGVLDITPADLKNNGIYGMRWAA